MVRRGVAIALLLGASPLAAQSQPALTPAPSPASGSASVSIVEAGQAQGPLEPARPTAEEVAEAVRLSLKPHGTRERCQAPKGNEIIVCAQNPNDLRVKSDTDLGYNTRDGVPRAPDVFGIPQTGVIVARGCFIPPCPRKMPPIIDLKAIPEAPAGSDAARFKDDADAKSRAAPSK